MNSPLERPDAQHRAVAPAKLNLYLHVLDRRADGYHLIDSLVAFAAVHDGLAALPAAELSLEIRGPFAASLTQENDNLVLRAAHRLAEFAGCAPAARLILDKNLPVAGGIGGGSADAAAALRFLPRFWNLDLDDDDLLAIARTLGADVPVCFAGRAAFVGGIGEQLSPAPMLPQAGLVLVNPGRAVETAKVFSHPQAGRGTAGGSFEGCADAAALAAMLRHRRNDLTAAAVALAPEIETVLAALDATPGCLFAAMSGSGATCFGLFADEASAQGSAALLTDAHPEWWVAPTRLVSDCRDIDGAV